MFGLKLTQKKTPTTPPKNDGKTDPFESEEANFIFNWLTYSDDDMMDVEAPERMNFTCPSNYREKRSEELAARLMAKSQEQSDEGLKEMILSEAVLVAKVRKEIISIAKLAAAICPVQMLFGKRACDLLFDELPEVEVRNRKRSRKPSRDYLVKHQYVQEPQQQGPPLEQPPNTVSNGALQQMLLQQQMYDQAQAMMGSRMGYGTMFGGLPSIGPSPPTNNSFLGYPRERAMMPDDSLSPSLPVVNPLPPSGSTLDPQLWYLMMQQQQNIPHSNMLSMNDQLRNIPRQADLSPQGPPNEMPFMKQEQPSAFPTQAAFQSNQPVNFNRASLLPSGESSSSAPAPAPEK